ncbi:response regulator transcription factor [Lactobacillus sp. LL6]|uniref:response regulator transcription factor n=1 Tax=Lactobacillus sp. LL6 TaxID=2596827 RepID=UPI001185B63A|nr:response regulator transcription factor [Lactobacillus sp. LL6]TSO25395.1 response regulator transcription factor [Lactobacillus sp. LL6]
MKILLAEDEPQLSRVVKMAIETNGYDVDAVFNGKEAVDKVKSNAYDVIILDIMMPVMDGIEALKEIRAMGDKTYVMMLTAKAEVDDKVTGLESGADDYLTKPFSLKELIARLKSRERRDSDYSVSELQYGDITLNTDEQELISHNSIRLANKETDLLNYLMLNKEKEISTEDILNHVWKNDPDADSEMVWLYVSYLRQKLLNIQSSVKIEGDKGGSFKLIS